jgi:hypothetical protein
LLGVCVSADAATLLTAFGVLGFESSFAAFDAMDFDVRSFRAMSLKSFRIGQIVLPPGG